MSFSMLWLVQAKSLTHLHTLFFVPKKGKCSTFGPLRLNMETNWRYDDGRGKGYDENFDMLIWDRGGMGGMEPPSMEDLLIF